MRGPCCSSSHTPTGPLPSPLQVLKRRQERDLQQLVSYEVTRKELLDKQQKRVDEMEARNQELCVGCQGSS